MPPPAGARGREPDWLTGLAVAGLGSRTTLLYVTRGAFYPEASGGAELSDLALFRRLCARGWRIEVLCAFAPRESWLRAAAVADLSRLDLDSRVLEDCKPGFPCRRVAARGDGIEAWLGCLERCLDELRPDAVLGGPDPACPLLGRALERGLPAFFMAHSLAPIVRGLPLPAGLNVIASAPVTARHLAPLARGDVGVVLPLLEPDRYRVARRSPGHVTFVNPIPEKGLGVAVEVARLLPEERFLFVEGGWSGVENDEALLAAARALPNVELWPHQSDMRKVYAVTDILLVPSQLNESFGRVIVEAQVNGIPVVAADAGGLPFTIGEGGLLVAPRNDVDAYADALRRIRSDPDLRARLSRAALENSRRPEFEPGRQVRAFVDFVEARLPGGDVRS